MKNGIILPLAMLLAFLSCTKKDGTGASQIAANFTYSGNGTAPSTVQFTNTSSNASSYSWDFGDNSTSYLSSPSHTYNKGGVYTVTLTATGAGGTKMVTKTVNISTPTSVKITGVKLTQMSFIDANGAGWDSNSGPDVYCAFYDANDNLLFKGNPFNDLIPSQIPVLWTLSTPYQITSFSSTYKIRIYDEDVNDFPSNADDFLGGYQFSFSNFTANGYPSVVTLFITGSTTKIDLALQWQ
jgi:PKD repeat protein